MVKQYLNNNDIRMKLHRTLVFYDGQPYFAECYGETDEKWSSLKLTPLYKGKSFDVSHYDEKLDTSAPKLGYINYKGSAYYLSRFPNRVSNQGLRSDNIWSIPNRIGSGYFTSPEFADSLLDKFPKLKTAEEMIRSLEWNSVAISKQFAIGIKSDLNIGLFQQETLIGTLQDSGRYLLKQDKSTSFAMKLLDKLGIQL